MRVINAFLPLVQKSKRKVIIGISSLAGTFGRIPMLLPYLEEMGLRADALMAYRMSKAAVNLRMTANFLISINFNLYSKFLRLSLQYTLRTVLFLCQFILGSWTLR